MCRGGGRGGGVVHDLLHAKQEADFCLRAS